MLLPQPLQPEDWVFKNYLEVGAPVIFFAKWPAQLLFIEKKNEEICVWLIALIV